jgi:uncharacterized membrane protein
MQTRKTAKALLVRMRQTSNVAVTLLQIAVLSIAPHPILNVTIHRQLVVKIVNAQKLLTGIHVAKRRDTAHHSHVLAVGFTVPTLPTFCAMTGIAMTHSMTHVVLRGVIAQCMYARKVKSKD